MTRFAKLALCALAATSFACSSSPIGVAGVTGGSGAGTRPRGGGSTGGSSGGSTGGGSSSATGGSTGAGDAGSFEPLASGWANGICQALNACHPAATYYQSGCAAQIESTVLAGGFGPVAADVAAGSVVYDPGAAAACFGAVAALGCDIFSWTTMASSLGCIEAGGFDCGENGASVSAACSHVLIGQLPLGAGCSDDDECDAGYCNMAGPSSGTCTAYSAAGASCGNSAGSALAPCGAGIDCVMQANGPGMTCLAQGQAGASCGMGSPSCAYPLDCVSGLCTQPGGPGSACGSGVASQTYNGGCAPGSYCKNVDGGMQLCASLLAQGQPCGQDDSGLSSGWVSFPDPSYTCAAGLTCAGFAIDPTTGAVTPGTCLPPSDVGGSCALAADAGTAQVTGCLVGLACVAGSCQVPPTSGPCDADPAYPCNPEGDYCDPRTQTCQPQLPRGAACNSGHECLTGFCDGTGHCAAS